MWDPESGESLATLPGQSTGDWPSSIASQPSIRTLACAVRRDGELVTEILELDPDVLLGRPRARSVTYTSAKVVLVGDSGVGKTGLGWRLTHGEFMEHASTHGQQFWLLDDLGITRADGADARRSCGTSPDSRTTGSSTRCSSTTPTSRSCSSIRRATTIRCAAWSSG